jgi:hypothetical protein
MAVPDNNISKNTQPLKGGVNQDTLENKIISILIMPDGTTIYAVV